MKSKIMTSIKIKSQIKFRMLLAIAVGLPFSGCKDDFTPPAAPAGSTIVSVVAANTELTIFLGALQKTNQAASLDNNNSGRFTVFAPSDSAFVAYFQTRLNKPAYTEDSVLTYLSKMSTSSTVTISALSTILTYHIVSSALTSGQLTGNGQVFSTLNGARLSISKTGSTVILNANQYTAIGNVSGAKVRTVDAEASNGVIHTINRVLVPVSSASVMAFLGMSVSYATTPATVNVPGGNTNYNVMANALKVAGLATTILPNVSPLPDYTLWVPDDASFTAYLMGAYPASVTNEATAITFIKSLSSSTTPTLAAFTDTMSYHVVSGRILSTDWSNSQNVNTLLKDKSVTVNINGSVYTVGDASAGSADATVTGKDNLTNAGVVHVINGVLLPN